MSLFILGIERSATTWVSNILDAHPDTDLFMEPMSVFTTRFKQWPNRFEKIEDVEKMSRYFRDEMEVLRSRKRWALTRVSNQSIAWNLDLTIADFLVTKKIASDAIIDFYELNFHRKNSFGSYPKSNNRTDVIKSLRLNFNPDIIQKIDSQARVIVTVRDMASAILSIQKQLNRGNLSELRNLMMNKFGEITPYTLFEYWQLSYNTLLTGLDDTNTPYLVLKHPFMLHSLTETVEKLIHFTGLSDNQAVYRYLEESNRAGSGIHSTNRSRTALIEQSKKAWNELSDQLKSTILKTNFHPSLTDLVEFR